MLVWMARVADRSTYNRLEKHFEVGDHEGKVYGPCFHLRPIPQDDMEILAMNNERINSIAKE